MASDPRHGGRLAAALVLGAVLVLCGCATTAQGGALGGGRDTAEIRDQLFKLQKDSARLLSAVEELRGGGDQPAAASCADAASRVENLELQMHAIQEQISATQRRLDEVLIALRTMRGAPPVAWNETPEFGSGTPSSGGAPPPPPAAGSGAAAEPGAAPSGASPTDLFNAAYADYSRGKFELALAGFEGALRADPAGPLADDAQYWVGETLYAMGRYREAAEAFDAVIHRYPGEEKLPAAHLKKGLALFEARAMADGVAELQYVIETWPDSDEARIAREYFKRKGIVAE